LGIEFRPEQWLTVDEKMLCGMNWTLLAFGAGKRICIGKHLTGMQLYEFVAQMEIDLNISIS
jgi:hypothetical protein